jgi:serine/threonine-protein kinase
VSDAERWRQVDRIFAAALERPLAERAAFLDAACAGEPGLRREVERLLAADERSATFLERPAGDLLGLALDDGEEGGRLGPYRLLRRIGGGGMGAVYLARRDDAEYQREVAVKILHSGLAGTEAYHRFLAERQILARLEHPNIARLYDGGSTADGRPFLVMELVEGLPVDEYCDRQRLTVEQRLDLFRKICAAVQYAHQNLLVHRDLKPANLLVTAAGEPKLLDFGIAKQLAPAAETHSRTRSGLRVMTPSYASPEQVRGEAVTTASDVYSLGVLLYELLAGRSPYRVAGDAPYEIERAICEQEPERPSAALLRAGKPSPEEIAAARGTRRAALQRRLQGDLDNIVLMALRKEPGRRYGSVGQLTRDLERHRESLPVAARSDTLGYRTRKFLRRHRVGVGVAAAVILLVAGFMASLIAQGRRLAQERDKARYALSFLVDTFKQADPYHTRGERLTAREILDRGADRVSRELAGQPDVQAAVMDTIGEVDLALGRYDQAAPLLERALALRRRTGGSESLEVAHSLEHLAALQSERFKYKDAEKLLRQSLAIRRRLQGADALAVARTLNQLGGALSGNSASPEVAAEVEKLYRQALDTARKAEGPAGPTVAENLLSLAKLKQIRGEYAQAEALFRQGLAVERQALGDRDPRLYHAQADFGAALIDAGKFKEAEAVLRRSLEAQRKILDRGHPDLISTLENLAEALHRQGRYPEMEAINREALALARAQYGPSNWRVAFLLGNLGAAVEAQDRFQEAIPIYEEALEIRRHTLGEGNPLVAQALLLLAEAHRSLEDYSESIRLARQALAILEKAEGPDHPHVAYAVREIGRSYMGLQRFSAAEPYLRRSLDIRRKGLEPGHIEIAKAENQLGRCLIELGRYNEAEALIRDARARFSTHYGPDTPQTQEMSDLLARIASLRGGRQSAAPAR